MNDSVSRSADAGRPFVAVICAVPLLGEAVACALDFAQVRTFAADGGDVAGLLSWVKPDAVIVDTDDAARDASAYAAASGVPALHICVQKQSLRLFRRGAWEDVSNGDGPTPETIRNVIAGGLYAREEVGRERH
jgi:hypothetical protein